MSAENSITKMLSETDSEISQVELWCSLTKIISTTIRHVYVHPVTLKLVFTDFDVSSFDFEYREFSNAEKNVIRQLTWDTQIRGKNLTKATGITDNIGNTDNRGGGCGKLNLSINDFSYTIENENGITVKDITEIVYRLKGSKYDWWYELFDSIQFISSGNISINFMALFDYGS